MINAYDIGYRALLGASWPLWASRRKLRDKVRDALATRDGTAPKRVGSGPAVLIHAVSVGELNAARGLIDALVAMRPELHVIVTTTTTAGNELAQKIFGPRERTTVVRFPIDLTPAIDRLLDAVRPTLVVLMELEVWPNFLKQCERRKIPVVIANGRITLPSFHKYRLLGPLAWSMFGRLERCIAQDETYAERFAGVGVPRSKIEVSGTMKFDAATVGDTVPGADELARDVGLPSPTTPTAMRSDDGADESSDRTAVGVIGGSIPPVLVAGSTGPGEEEIVLDVHEALCKRYRELRLVIVPRKPERFDEAARLIESRGYTCIRRSRHGAHPSLTPTDTDSAGEDATGKNAVQASPVILGDTMGELRKFYALATVVFVGRTLVDLGPKQHGSDMIEPCALAKPTVVGPFTGNFEEPMRAFKKANAITEVTDDQGLFQAFDDWLSDPSSAQAMGDRARDVVIAGKGAVARHVEVLMPLLE